MWLIGSFLISNIRLLHGILHIRARVQFAKLFQTPENKLAVSLNGGQKNHQPITITMFLGFS